MVVVIIVVVFIFVVVVVVVVVVVLADSGKTIIFRAKAKFFGQKPAAKNEKMYIFVFITHKNGIYSSSEIKCPKSWIFTNNYWVG